eukprot:3091397-Amphidinium_carterae.2
MATGVGCHAGVLSLTARTDGLVVGVESEKSWGVFRRLDDCEQLSLEGCAVIAPVRGDQTTQNEGGFACGRNLDDRPASSAEFLLRGVSGTGIREEEPGRGVAKAKSSERSLDRKRTGDELPGHAEGR